ncbi:hypothetical protein ACFQMM_13455 [Saliphagus sp. GCM10025308]
MRSTDDSATDRGSTARSESVCASRPDVVSRPSPSRECDHRTHGIGLSAGVATIGNGAPAVAFVNWFTNRPASDWDMVLVTVLSLLVGGLVGIRLAYVLSAREISVTLGVHSRTRRATNRRTTSTAPGTSSTTPSRLPLLRCS